MRFLLIGARKDAAMLRREPFGLVISIGIPLILAVLMNAVFGRSGNATPHGVLLLADEDRSIASGMLASVFEREPLGKMVTVRRIGRADGRAVMDRGEAAAMLIIPSGWQQAYLANEPSRLELFTNPSQQIVPAIVRESVTIALDRASAMRQGAPATPLVRLESQVHAEAKPFNFAALFFPCMIFMSLMMVANSLAGEIWRERMLGTLRRLAATPVGLAWYLGGRIAFVGFVLLAVGTVGLSAVHALAGVPVANFPAAMGWVMFSGSALYLLLLYVIMHAATQRTANVLGNILIFPFAFVGGCFLPFDIMPDWMARIGRMTPNGWAVTQFQAILSGSARPGSLAAATAALLAVSAIAFILVARRIRSFVL